MATESDNGKSDDKSPVPGTGSAGQTFLKGETIYLRALELGDAKHVGAWRRSIFPIPAEHAEELLKKEVPDQSKGRRWTYVACRVADDVPVGSLEWGSWDGRTTDLEVHAPDTLPDAGVVRAEMVRLMVPYLLHEREMMAVYLYGPDHEPEVAQAAEALGMTFTGRLREARWVDGERRDELFWELLHPVWTERLGAPAPVPDPDAARPETQRIVGAKRRPAVSGEPPKNAVMIGERVYLRPYEVEDAEKIAVWSRQEPETFFDNGRDIRSGIGFAHWIRKLAEDDPQEWVRFAIVLRENDELIGGNGLADIDWIHKTAETETFLDRPEYRGGGLGTEAKHLLLEYAFERLGLHQVRSFVWDFNTRSAAALRKQGYRDAGGFHWSGIKKAEFAGDVMFDYLASEWRAYRDAAVGAEPVAMAADAPEPSSELVSVAGGEG